MKKYKSLIIKIYNQLFIISDEIKDNHLDVYSAGTAFYLFISIIPFFIALFSIVPYTPISKEEILSIASMLPTEFDFLIQVVIAETYARNAARLSISLILAIWSAARGVMFMTKGFNEIYDEREKRNYFILRFWAAVYTLFIVVVLIILLIMGVFGKKIYYIIKMRFSHMPVHIMSSIATVFNMRGLIIGIVLFFLFLFLYVVLPNTKVIIKYQIPGAFLCSVGWLIFTKVFSVFTNMFDVFSMYGSLATVIASLLWLYSCMYILFICAELNNYLTFRKALHRITRE